MEEWITSTEAAQRLGVKRATLYTYVSRGVLRRRRDGDGSHFLRTEVDRLARERRHPGAPDGVLGMRAVSTRVSRVEEGELFLAGVPLADLADRPFAHVVELMLGPTGSAVPGAVAADLTLPLERRVAHVVLRLRDDQVGAPGTARVVGDLLAAVPSALDGVSPGVELADLPRALLRALGGREPAPVEVAVVNAALVAMTDHGLAATVVAARVAASAGAGTAQCLLAGLAALSGRWHGAVPVAACAVLRGEPVPDGFPGVPGFGHWRHSSGDPRAEVVLARLAEVPGAAPVLERVERLSERFGAPVNSDGALAAVVEVLGLPPASGEVFFQVARTVGMGAHVVEERADAPLRWRARDPEV